MQIEDVSGVRLAAGRSPQQQRNLTIRLCVLRQIVVDHERVPAAVTEVLADRAGRIRTDVEHRRRIGCGGRDDDRVAHRVVLFERPHDLSHGGLLLPDRVVDADDAGAALIDDRVHRDGGLAGLAVADDQLALAAADRHHAVDGLEPGLQRFLHGLPVDDTGSETLDRQELLRLDRTLAVDGLAQRIHHATEHLVADGNRDDACRSLDRVALFDLPVVAQKHGAHAVFFEIERDAEDTVGELEHLARHRAFDAVHAGNAVTEGNHAPHFGHVHLDRVATDLVANDLGDFFRSDIHINPDSVGD